MAQLKISIKMAAAATISSTNWKIFTLNFCCKVCVASEMTDSVVEAVELALSTSFGSGKVQEWFEYGGEPNHYRIFDVDIRKVNDNIRTFLQILEVVSRKSAVLDSIRAISVRELILYFGAVMSVTKKFELTTGSVDTDIDIMGDEAGNALCDWDGGLIMMDKEATV